jgi:phosphoenolpyruvate synthase/pyruvate phosphate dikinase
MKLDKVLTDLEELLSSWGIDVKDWILVSQYAYKLLGYDVKFRKGHFNILVRSRKIPWKVKEGIEVCPPRNSGFWEDFNDFIKKTKFDFDINLATDAEFKKKKGKYVNYILSDKKIIHVQKPTGAIKEYEKLLSFSTKEGLGPDRLDKDIRYIKDMISVLSKKREGNTLREFKKLLEKYLVAKKRSESVKVARTKRLVGIEASGGSVVGKVRVVRSPKDVKGFRKGDILVVSSTSPSMFAALPRVSAIVTDHGGMLSHAAIFAREMGIPCIVGTKTASKRLKTGDFVRVDAEKGIVVKIE